MYLFTQGHFTEPRAPGGTLETYAAGTLTPLATYTDQGGGTPNPTTVSLDSNGAASVWLSTAAYRMICKDSSGVTLWDVDNIRAGAAELLADLSSTSDAAKGAALIGYSPSLSYAGGVGQFLNTIYARSAAEIAASVTPTSYAYAPGDVRRYGAVGDGSTDDYTAFSKAALVSGTHQMVIPYTSGGYKIGTPLVLPANASVLGVGRPLLTASVNGSHIMSATSVGTITVRGVRFRGSSASTSPTTGFGGYSSANTGLLTISICTDVRVEDCEFDTFYNGLTTQQCTRVWLNQNRVYSFQSHGILASCSAYFQIERNTITGCTQSGAVVAYGIHATGDQAGGKTEKNSSISFNVIDGVPSWDAIMSHDVDGLDIIGNICRDVRHGIDIGHLVSTNVVKNVKIIGNTIESTTTNTWGASAAEICGIGVAGYDATNRVLGGVIANNEIRGFFATAGMVGGGDPNHIIAKNLDDFTISGNVITGGGSVVGNAGIGIGGTINRLAVTGNTMQGDFTRGAIRLATVTGDVISIVGNVIKQASTGVEGVLVSGSTISAFAIGANPSNSTIPWSQTGSTITLSGTELEATTTYDPPSIAAGSQAQTTVTVTGAAVGDYAIGSFGGALSGLKINAEISSANTATVTFSNNTAGAVDLGSATLRVRVLRKIA